MKSYAGLSGDIKMSEDSEMEPHWPLSEPFPSSVDISVWQSHKRNESSVFFLFFFFFFKWPLFLYYIVLIVLDYCARLSLSLSFLIRNSFFFFFLKTALMSEIRFFFFFSLKTALMSLTSLQDERSTYVPNFILNSQHPTFLQKNLNTLFCLIIG